MCFGVTPSLLLITISCYLSHLPYLGWDITGFKRPCAYICFLAPVISRLACVRDIFCDFCDYFCAVAMATGYIYLLLADAGPYAALRLEGSSALKVELWVISSVL